MDPTPNPRDTLDTALPATLSAPEADAVEQSETPELAEFSEQITALKAEALAHLASVCETSEYKALNEMGEPDFAGYHYMTAYSQSYEAIMRAHHALPGVDIRQGAIPVSTLYRDLHTVAPVLYQQGVINLASHIHEHIDHISPKKRERLARQPEKWNYGALAKQQREKFLLASRKELLTGEPEAVSTIQEMIGTANMAAVYSLLGRRDVEPLTNEQADEASFEFGSKLLRPVLEDEAHRLGGEGQLLPSLLESYRVSFEGEVVDFTALQSLHDLAGDRAADYLQRLMIEGIVERACSAYSKVTDVAAMRETYFQAIRTLAEGDAATFIQTSQATLNILHNDIFPALGKVTSKLDALKDVAGMTGATDPMEMVELIEARQLDWEVLPPGEIETISREIVRQAQSENYTPTIDLERLKVLDNVRTLWGAENTYYARGALSARRIIQDGAKSEADQYLMLILQEKDSDGSVIAEHAIAESPIAGPNALYVFRQDVSEGLKWKDVMSLPKNYARELGARNVKHSLSRYETDLVGSMTEKVTALMTASPEEFRTLQFNGMRGFRFPRSLMRTAEPEHIA
jgi:hypothetical protein